MDIHTIFNPIVMTIGNYVLKMVGLLFLLVVGWLVILCASVFAFGRLQRTTLMKELQKFW